MKHFHFQLDTVLDYKQQVLDALMVEHGALMAQVNRQTEVLEAARREYAAYNAEYTEKKRTGLTVLEALTYQNGLTALERNIQRAHELLLKYQRQAEAKRLEVVEAKKETSSIEKLREIKSDSYNRLVQKEEEAMIDELVLSSRSMADHA